MARIDEMLAVQAAELASLHDREARRFLQVFEDARRELWEQLNAFVALGKDQKFPYTAQWTRTMLVQADEGARRLRHRLGEQLGEAVERQKRGALQSLIEVVRTMEPEFLEAGGMIEVEALRRMTESEGLLLHRYSIDRYGAELVADMQRELTVGMARGMTIPQLRDRLAGLKGIIHGKKHRAELIVRMELNSAFNRYHLDSIKGASAALDQDRPSEDKLQKKADEYLDLRNHAISRVLDGQVQPPDQPFKVPVALVEAEHEKLQAMRRAARLKPRRLGGILWPVVGGHYTGNNYPAHFWERGRIVPWRRSWTAE